MRGNFFNDCVMSIILQRYPEDKTDITGINNEPWHYRFVGQKAALEMQEKDMCLEEYLEYLSEN